jgi:two-component system NtrC family sensor kinase
LWNLALLMVAALSLAVITALATQALQPRYAVAALLFLIAADLAVLFVFGRYLIGRLVLKPMRELAAAADELAAGRLERRAAAAETREFNLLAERLNGMTEALLDTQSQLVRAEKLAGIGRLAAGVAHEVGNPLAAIGTYLEVLKKRPGDPEVAQAIARETERIDRIVRSLLTYARPAADEVGVVDAGGIVRNVIELLTHQGVLKNHELRVELEDNLPQVRANPHALEQVFVNLALNAVDAAASGSVTIGAQAYHHKPGASESARRGEAEPPPGRRARARRPWRSELANRRLGVLLYVADTGPGVPQEDRDKVFDPFFSTKSPGQGTGLGLAIVQRTVHESGGLVWVEDSREGGATFKIFLPAAEHQ